MNAAKRPARVLLGATCYTDAEGTMQIAVLAAREIGAELHGLLVVDESILAAASAPRARSVGFSGARIAQISAEQMQAAFRADARRFREQLLRTARGASLGAGFRQERGRLAAVLEQGAGAGDLIVYGFRRAPRDSDCVILIASATDPAPRLTALAAHLSEGLGKPLIVLVPAQTAEVRPAPLAGLAGVDVIAFDTPEALLARLERCRPAVVVASGPYAALPPVARLLDAARCPLILEPDTALPV